LVGRYQHREAGGPADFESVRAFLVGVWRSRGEFCTLHVGDLSWRLHRSDSDSLAERLHLWHGPAGELVGFALFDPPDSCDMLISPHHRGGLVEQGQLAWAEEQARRCCARNSVPARLTVGSLDGDPRRLTLLEARGYVRQAHGHAHLRRSLDGPTEDPILPSRFITWSMAEDVSVEQRVEAHRAIWPGSDMTNACYGRMMRCGGYDPQLDVLALAPDSAIAAFCLAWRDASNQVGLLEPVGCCPAHRRKGLARAVVLEGLRRLQAQGSTAAIVTASTRNPAALALYESCGFQQAFVDEDWLLRLD
jgi:ribosomal protein S18 acetylase RimI-like enzyme